MWVVLPQKDPFVLNLHFSVFLRVFRGEEIFNLERISATGVHINITILLKRLAESQ